MKLTLPEDACGRRLSFTMISKSCDLPFFDQIHEARLVFESVSVYTHVFYKISFFTSIDFLIYVYMNCFYVFMNLLGS